jgi:hypothetical protein
MASQQDVEAENVATALAARRFRGHRRNVMAVVRSERR